MAFTLAAIVESDVVGKIDVVRRQIVEAVRLFFDERDTIVIHTLIASAHQILMDVGKGHGTLTAVKKMSNLGDGDVATFHNEVNYPYNYFKHANRDPNEKIDVGPLRRLTQDFIMDAIWMLLQLDGAIPFEAKVFWFWFVSFYHDEFDNLPSDGAIAQMQNQNIETWSFLDISAFIRLNKLLESGT